MGLQVAGRQPRSSFARALFNNLERRGAEPAGGAAGGFCGKRWPLRSEGLTSVYMHVIWLHLCAARHPHAAPALYFYLAHMLSRHPAAEEQKESVHCAAVAERAESGNQRSHTRKNLCSTTPRCNLGSASAYSRAGLVWQTGDRRETDKGAARGREQSRRP
eukprot:COSAG06_NODE_7592_length_2448_cov_27.669221_1_plen_161_part_00